MYETTTKTEATRARVGLGYTVNMGNFESLRVDISIEDSARQGEAGPVLVDRVYRATEAKLIEKVNAIREQMETTNA